MQRTRRLSPLIVAVASSVLFLVAPLSAVGPSAVMFYGGDLAQPMLVRPGNPSVTPTGFLWNPVNGGASYGGARRGTLPQNLEGRRYVSFAVFWGRIDDPAALKPSDASQHGRVYLPTASEPAVIVVTPPNMMNPKDANAGPEPVPVPKSLSEFVAGWALTAEQTLQLRQLAGIL
jgi:hypothetical protein